MDKNFYITTPIYYPSGKPHMGHAYSIYSEFFARFKRFENYDVFLTGTDNTVRKLKKRQKKIIKSQKFFVMNFLKHSNL